MPKHLLLLFVCRVLCTGSVSAQTTAWKFSLSYGSTIGIARVNNKFYFQASDVAFVQARPEFSQKWFSYRGSRLTSTERFLYGSFLGIEAERPLGRYAFQTGLETGGRSFRIREYPSENGRYPDDRYAHHFANQSRQNILITSLPFRFVRLNQKPNPVVMEPVAGISLNYAYAPAYTNYFYRSEGVSKVFPSVDLGLRIREQRWDRFSFNVVYQQGFYSITGDEVQLLSSLFLKEPPARYPVTYKGSSLRFLHELSPDIENAKSSA